MAAQICLVTDPEELMRTHLYCLSLLQQTTITRMAEEKDRFVFAVLLMGFMLIVLLVLIIVGISSSSSGRGQVVVEDTTLSHSLACVQ